MPHTDLAMPMPYSPAHGAVPAVPVVAFPCSGGGAGQWRWLAQTLAAGYSVAALEHLGSGDAGTWSGARAFHIADEAERALALVDRLPGRVHLVGHSYGGGVALHVALARPRRVTSVALYEPSLFHLLKSMGARGDAALDEIRAVQARTVDGLATGDYHGAARAFVDYWGGAGAFDALKPAVREGMTRWLPKAPLDFHALIEDTTPVAAYTELDVPVLVMRGERAHEPSRMIAEQLAALLPRARLAVVQGAGHMGPVTHAEEVAAAMAGHVRASAELSAALARIETAASRATARPRAATTWVPGPSRAPARSAARTGALHQRQRGIDLI